MIHIDKIIKINKKHGGNLINKSQLDFAIDKANREEDIYKSNAYLLRAIVVDHPFLDGNKKTATEVILERFSKNKIKCNEKEFSRGIVNIAKSNETSIEKISRRLKLWCPKK